MTEEERYAMTTEIAVLRDNNEWLNAKLSMKEAELADWESRYYHLHDVLRTYQNALDAARATIVLNIFDQLEHMKKDDHHSVAVPKMIEWFSLMLLTLDPRNHT